jgi:hypothetical protein
MYVFMYFMMCCRLDRCSKPALVIGSVADR